MGTRIQRPRHALELSRVARSRSLLRVLREIGLEHVVRTVANRIGAAMIVVGLLVASALMARVSDAVAPAGFCFSGAIALYMVWRIIRTPSEF